MSGQNRYEILRFLINGAAATAVHFAVLVVLIEVVGIVSAGLSNALASIVATCVSYAGNKIFVFESQARHRDSGVRFIILYMGLLFWYAGSLFLWSDVLGFNYKMGFVIAVIIGTVLSYMGNKFWVFRPRGPLASLHDP